MPAAGRIVERAPLSCALLGLLGLLCPGAPFGTAVAFGDTGLVVCADYGGPGAATTLATGAPWTVTPDVASLGVDPVARWHDGLVYVVNRSAGNNVQVLDPGDGWHTVRQFGLGAGCNPQDIAFAPDGTAYVSCYDQAILLHVDPVAGTILGTISTAPFADADGLPETGWLAAVGSRLYVTAQRLDRNNWYAPSGPGLLLVFDLAAGQWLDADPAHAGVDAVALAGANPWGQPEVAAGGARLRLGCVGYYGLADGGVEEIDLVTLRSLGFLVTESALGGDLLDFVTIAPDRAWAIVSDASFHTSVKAWDPRDGSVGATARASDQYAYPDLAWDGGPWLFLADRTVGAAGVRVFDAANGVEQTSAAVPTGLPPAWIVLPGAVVPTAAPPAAVAGVALAPPFPNPANPGCEIRLRGPAGVVLPVIVADLRGRRVRAGAVRLDAQGRGSYRFDGRDDSGLAVATGRYLVTAGGAAVGLTIVR